MSQQPVHLWPGAQNPHVGAECHDASARVSLAPPPAALAAMPRPAVPDAAQSPATPIVQHGRDGLDRLLGGLVDAGGSDLHLASGQPPRFALAHGIVPVPGEAPLSQSLLEQYLSQIAPPARWEQFLSTGDADFAHQIPGMGRFRVNVGRTLGTTTATIRHIRSTAMSLDALGAPPQIRDMAALRSGLCVFVGETGAGKSSTLAALVDLYNETRDGHIVTIEDPVEYVHTPKRCQITHREVGTDTPTFESAMRHVRRQNPSVILVGEMRDYETMHYALEAADSGHLVLTTLHAGSTADTVSRIVNAFPSERQNQIRSTLASVLKAVVWQALVPTGETDGGRVLTCEVMVVNGAIRAAINANNPGAIDQALMNRSQGSIHRDAYLVELLRAHRLTEAEALPYATSAEEFKRILNAPVPTR